MKRTGDRTRRRIRSGWYRLRRREDDAETTRVYTDQEIQSLSRTSPNNAGIIRPGTADFHIPSDLVDRPDGKQGIRLPGVMLVIVTLSVIFIAIIAYFVSRMPPKN